MKFNKALIVLILVFAFLLRIVKLQSYPPSLTWDELSHGYNAYSILKTGKDEWGARLPLIFRAFGDYKLPLYIYLSLPSLLLFGLNSFSVRLLSVLAGTFLVYFVYLIIKHLFPQKKILALLAASLVAFSPGLIFLSRIALEANLYLLFFTISIYFIFIKKYSQSSFFYALCLLTYNSSRVLLPFYLILLLIIFLRHKLYFTKNYLKFIPFILILVITIFQTLNQSGQARYQWVSLLDSGSINQINELRQRYPRFLVNKFTYFSLTATKNYLSHFHPQFLFFKGGSHYQFSLPDFYLFSPFFLPLFILGLLYLIKNIKNNNNKILLAWLFVSPIASSITRDAPHVLRSITLLPIVAIIITTGLNYLYSRSLKISLFLFFFILLLGQFTFWPRYIDYSTKYSSSWQYGYQEAVSYIKNNYSEYEQIIISKKYGEAHEFLLFYWPWNPSDYQNDPQKKWDYHANWYWVDAFNKFIFINDWEIKDFDQYQGKKTLLVTSPGNYVKNKGSLIKTVYFLDNSPAFDILSIYEK